MRLKYIFVKTNGVFVKYKKNGEDIEIECQNGSLVLISKEDEFILKEFDCVGITGSVSKYCFVEKSIKTKYGSVRQRVYLHKAILQLRQQLVGL